MQQEKQDIPLLAIVLLSYNGRSLLEKFLPTLLQCTPDKYEIVVVNNGSTDDTADYLNQHHKDVRVITIDNNKGFTNGYVKSLSQIEAKYYCLISADIEVTEGWVDPVIELLESDEKNAVCQPKIRSYNEKQKFEYAGAAGGFIDKFGYLFCRGRLFFTVEEDQGQYNTASEVFWASGACFFIRSEIYHKLGGLDDDFFAHMEEVDMCWRVRNAGYKVWVQPKSLVYHVGGAIITYGSPGKVYRNYRNSLILLTKNLPMSQLIWKLPFRLLLDGLAFFLSISRKEYKAAFTIIKAHFHFNRSLFKWLGKRKNSRKFVNQPDHTGWYPKSVVVKYFLQGVRTFDRLKWKP